VWGVRGLVFSLSGRSSPKPKPERYKTKEIRNFSSDSSGIGRVGF
jgi:hypothetical protein